MPKRTDIKTILILGSGPIVIGQGCEFDYSGTQACKALRREGFRVVLVNSNPATIMTDPEFSDRTYIEPITPAAVTKVIELQAEIGDPIQAVLPTLGGQTALNCACALFDDGTLEKHGIEMIGANRHVIHRAEDRAAFNQVCANVGLRVPESRTVSTLAEAREFLETIGLPAIIRPAFTLGGSGGGIAYNTEEFDEIVTRGLRLSMIKQVQVDRSLLGWKEYELEVVRDKRDNCIVVCGIENFDPMGVHTGDSITFAPIMTLTDKEYQVLRDASFAIMREVGVETGGSNVQFAVNPNPEDGKFEFVVVEMNPRVSRSSALASKATGFPIAKIAAKLAVGYTLDELRNDITGTTSACFEPSIDYIVTKMPRWTFEKFPEADETLTTQMKSVGEAMSIGRTLTESLQKAIRSMEVKRFGLGLDRNDDWLEAQRADKDEEGVPRRTDGSPIEWPIPEEKLSRKLTVPSQGRLYYIRYAMKMGWSIERINGLSKIDPFFLDQIKRLVEFEDELCACDSLEEAPRETLFRAKQMGYSDAQLANLYLGTISSDTILKVRAHRKSLGIEPVYKLVDTCAAEFEAVTPYYYSTYERGVERHEGTEARSHEVEEAADAHSSSVPSCLRASVSSPDDEIRVTDRKKVIILGGGPNRIGQGIEFDYCCVHAAFAAKELGFESVMINSNPETVSTDYDTSDLLFFEPLTLEDVLNVVERLNNLQGSLVSPFIELSDAVADRMQKAWRESGLGPGVVITASGFSPEDGFDGHGWSHFVVTSDGVIHDVCIYAASGETTVHRPSEAWLQRVAELSDDPDDDGNLEQWRVEAARMCSGRVHGLIVQFGGQTPLNLAHGLARAGAPIIGTSLDSIDLAEDRDRFDKLLQRLNLRKPPSGIARSVDEAVEIAGRITYPVLVRPSYVLGGRGMEICSDEKALRHYMATAVDISELDNAPVLIDKFLDRATEVDVDVVADFDPSGRHEGTKTRRHEDGAGENDTAGSSSVPSCLSASVPSSVPSCLSASVPSPQAIVCGVMEHIEQAGIHSGDSACTTPPWSLNEQTEQEIRRIARRLAEALRVNGLMNVQMAVRQNDNGSGEADEIYILEVNPRASRTAPFVGKAKHVPWPRIAARAMMGVSLAEQNVREVRDTGAFAVKESVFPFSKFPGVDVVLGPEMRSTGEVMGIDASLPIAFAKSQFGAGVELPLEGAVFVSVHERDRQEVTGVARLLTEMGFTLYATDGTAAHLEQHGISANVLQKIASGARPNVIDLMSDGAIQLVINTPTKTGWQTDEGRIRAGATRLGIPMITTMTGALAVAKAIYALRERGWGVKAMQDYAAESGAPVIRVKAAAGEPAAR